MRPGYLVAPLLILSVGMFWWSGRSDGPGSMPRRSVVYREAGGEMEGGRERDLWEFKRLRDPATGRIPEGIRKREMEWLRSQPVRQYGNLSRSAATMASFSAVGPTQNGGRTRALAYDVRYNGTTNRIMIAGGINGGIYRSTNGGGSWTFVHPVDELRSVSCLAQDPRPGFQDTWYAGTGEGIGISAALPSGFVIGNGLFKSTDNGLTWTKLASTADNNPSNFNFFDIVHALAVNPANGHVYAAIHQRIVRSTDNGASWSVVLNSSPSTSSGRGVTDIMVNKAGTRLFASMSGRVPDRAAAGLWTSATGNSGEWTRVAGGLNGQADSVAGWKGYDNTLTDGEFGSGWARIVFALAPSNQNLLYVVCENGDKATDEKPEADLFRCDMSTTPFTWTRLTTALKAKLTDSDGTYDTWYETQGGYDMAVAVHPTLPNYVFVGGVNLYRSTDGFATAANTSFVGGYGSTTYDDPGFISHPDFHVLVFDPTNPNRLVTASDGGLVYCDNANGAKIKWNNMNSQYQTIQYYYVGIDPTPGSRNYFGGCQDNSTTLRDREGILDTPLSDSNDHYILVGGDGCQVGMSKKNLLGQQHLFASAQEGYFVRMRLFEPYDNTLYTYIKPAQAGTGQFVTYYHLDEDNTDLLYYASNDSLFRTTSSITVTTNTGWTGMTGVAATVFGNISAMATTRGNYATGNMLYIGSDEGRLYRLPDPRNAAATAVPAVITPTGMSAGSVVSDIAVNPRNHDTLMVVASNYGINSIFWTGNATAATPTWQVVEGNLTVPSVRSCAIVAKTNGVEYYVGTSTGLFSTTGINGSSTAWSRELDPSGMMNTAIVNSMAYRWQDNTLVIGTHGNGMFVANIGNAVNLPTPVTEPIRNDPGFMKSAFPTATDGTITYLAGNMTGIRKVRIQVTSLTGQLLYDREAAYRDGSIDVRTLSKGMYILTITSPDRRHQFTRRFLRN